MFAVTSARVAHFFVAHSEALEFDDTQVERFPRVAMHVGMGLPDLSLLEFHLFTQSLKRWLGKWAVGKFSRLGYVVVRAPSISIDHLQFDHREFPYGLLYSRGL